ncbi:MAG TPA: phosphoenolpyruvate carboxykinase (ATP), partial [Methylomirabilota bacterium]|nr:phosphoenolpyruvate carboxykinase (ATP) [Methylomirabilota bacterium]
RIGVGHRIQLAHTRAILDAIHGGALEGARTRRDPVFGLDAVVECPGLPAEVLWPREAWKDAAAYETAAKQLAGLFAANFKTYETGVSAEVRAVAPVL